MKKVLLYTIFFLLFGEVERISAQNFVPNGDFEFYTSCPTGWDQIGLAFPWYDPNNSTSDYFNACAPVSSTASVPNHTLGYWQYAHSGVGYSGLYTIQNNGGNYREYIQVQLIDTLSNQKCYSVTFYANLSNKLKKGANNLGAYISQTAVTCPMYLSYGLTPQILLPGNPPIIDTVNWIKISGTYHSIGGEKYLTIGNFNYDSTTVTQTIDPLSPNAAYYYIDDVSIYEIKTANAGRDTAICHGDSVMLGTTSYEGVTYSWLPTAGLSNASIGNPMASPATTTTYYLTQTTSCATTVDSVVVSLGDCTVGVREYGKDKPNFKLYPNPNHGEMTLTYHLKDGEAGIINIYDLVGKLISSRNLVENKTTLTIDETNLNAAAYYYSIFINSQKVQTDKLIIVK
jgi:hypothetical protein